ncbi:uncharacterized protein LOC132544026 [Ylistrum balloti]|uniref:uncharacterized protein LOC132544026 n=1 Tax=Ylistrum balloti TaxID=509963 RepID=UPI002905EC9C|nr:uncharacterized protein LOC132544026 [Ylistrum balloti]
MSVFLFCAVCTVAVVSSFPMEGFAVQNTVGPPTNFFSKFIPKSAVANMTSNPMLQWIPDFISQTVNAARERKMMKQMRQSMMTDVDMGGLGGMMAQSPGGSMGLSLSNTGAQGFAMAADNPMGELFAGGYGAMADGMI